MIFAAGYMGLLTAFTADDSIPLAEYAGPGYARQPVSFGTARNGISKLATPYTFGALGTGFTIGRVLFAGPASTVPMLILPFGNGSRSFPMNGPTDSGDAGSITLFVSAMAAYADGSAFTSPLDSGSDGYPVIGTVYDSTDELISPWSNSSGPGGVVSRAITTGTLCLGSDVFSVVGGQLLPVSTNANAVAGTT